LTVMSVPYNTLRTYTITIKGVSGSISKTTTVTLTLTH
jgi:hypothetical protein